MNAFGRILNTVGLNQGGLMPLEGNPPFRYPTVRPHTIRNGVNLGLEMMMFQTGAIAMPPIRPIWTRYASGGCVPICAAEITPARVVLWTYLMHGHGGNMPVNVAAAAANPADVYVCMMVYSGASSFYAAQNFQDDYFAALDPGNAIPNANALLIYGDHTQLVITKQAMIAVEIVD